MAKGISLPVVQSGLEASIQEGVKNVGKINIPATVDPSAFKNLAQPLGRVSGLATEFEKSIAASNARVLAFGASVGIINGVQNAFADLVRTGIEVQKTLADIAAISGQGGKQLSQFGDALFDIGKTTGQTFKTAAQAALEFSRQGLSVEETLKRTTDALTLTRFTTLNAAEAVDVLTAAANSFSDTGITTAQIINKLVAVDTKFAVSAEDLANGLARAGSIAQEVGVNFDQLNAAITIAQERTARGGAVIGNALKTIFTRLRSDETVEALRSIGVESLNAQGQLKGAIPLLEEVAQKLQGLSGGERVQILEAIASKYNINILSALLNDLNGANSKFSEAVAVSAGASNQAYERQIELNKTLAAQINNATVSVTQLFNKLSEIGVTDSLATLLKFVSDLINGFNKIVDSEGLGGNIAKGLIKGISDVFFTVGLPIIGAIFIKLTRDIAQFGVESLKTILGINQQVRERQALEQAVVNTLIQDQQVMASILALSGNRAKQEEYLLGVYNRQLNALQQVKNIAATVTPALMSGGLTATSGRIERRGAGGYLPAQEAADVRRGVGGANPSSKVVSIPNFAFGGGKRGTMIANTSEYIVPNFANGGSAIFNKDMARAYGLPAGAKKISAAGGYVPNFARYVYDADRIQPDKNALLKAILASGAKKNLIVGPAGSGKSTYGASLGSFITNPGQLVDATEIDILSGAARTKDGGISKNFQQIADAVNASGGKISYLYTGNMDILSRRSGRISAGPAQGDLRSQKQIAGSMYAPLNQFDFISKIKRTSRNFEMMRGANGYIPNFANLGYVWRGQGVPNIGGKIVDTLNKTESGEALLVGNQLRMFKKDGENLTQKQIEDLGWRLATKEELNYFNTQKASRKKASSIGRAAMLIPSGVDEPSAFAEPQIPENKDYSSVSFPIYNLKENRLKTLKGQTATIPGYIDELQKNTENIGKALTAKLIGSSYIDDNIYKKAWDASYGAQSAVNSLSGGLFEAGVRYLTHPEGTTAKDNSNTLDFPNLSSPSGRIVKNLFDVDKEYAADLKGSDSGSIRRKFASQLLKNGLAASRGYIPNFAAGSPLGDAINREMAAGVSPSKIRITQDGRLRNAGNPNGLAVINTRDEPNGKIPNFASRGRPDSPSDVTRAENRARIEEMKLATLAAGGSTTVDLENASIATNKYTEATKVATKIKEEEKNNIDKTKIGLDKMFYALAGVTTATSILEANIKKTDSVFANLFVGLGKAAQGASSGALLGQTAKDLSAGTKFAGALKNAPVIGAIAMGLQGAIDFGLETAAAKIENAPTKQAGIESVKDITKEQDIKAKMTELGQRIIANPKDDKTNAAYDELKRKLREITKTREDEGKIDEKAVQALKDRIALNSVINSINESFATGQNKRDIKRAEEQSKIIAGSALLNESQLKEQELKQKLLDIDNKKFDLQESTRNKILEEISSASQLATVDRESLITLMRKVENNEDLEGIYKELAKLETEGAVNAREKVQKLLSQNTIQSATFDTEKRRTELIERANIALDNQRKLMLLILDTTREEIKLQEELDDILEDQDIKEKQFDIRKPLSIIERNIARKNFPSSQEQLDLTVAKRKFAIASEELKLQEERDKIIRSAERSFKSQVFEKTSKLSFLSPEEKQKLTEEMQLAQTPEEIRKISQTYAQKAFTYDTSKKEFVLRQGINTTKKQTEDELAALESLRDRYSVIMDERITGAKKYYEQEFNFIDRQKTKEEELDELRVRSKTKAGAFRAIQEIEKETYNFQETFAYNTTNAFRDGLRDAMSAAISQTDDLGSALQNVAMNFLKTMQSQFLNQAAGNITLAIGKGLGMAKGGLVTGGSGYRDDVPRMLTGGEFVMRKSAVQKYGVANLAKMNNGGIFLPGVRGGGNITGYDQLRAFANQTTTSGATDILRGGGSSAFINLEDQSSRLSRFGLLNEDTINQEIRSAQEQGLNIIAQREAYRTQQRKAFQQQLVGTILSAAASYGAAKIGSIGALKATGTTVPYTGTVNDFLKNLNTGRSGSQTAFAAYGGMIRRYASGGPVDDIPALLMSGEYVMNRGATSKYGKRLLDSMNQGRAPRFADGGEVGASTTTTESNAKMMGDVSININVTGQNSQTETQGNTNQGGIDYKKMSERIKAVVLETINEEKRLGGSLRPGR